jgi:hypothetical protein
MNEQYFYADVNLPFHVWVREREGARGYRWVLRNASEMQDDPRKAEAANDPGTGKPKRSAS